LQSAPLSVLFSVFFIPFAGSAYAQHIPEPIPGVQITNGSYPWAVDVFEGKQELVPIHHTNVGVNNHKGANVAGSLAGSFLYQTQDDD
jgi:hypothetical protein